MSTSRAFINLNSRIVACRRCPRLINHCAKVAREKRAAYRNDAYHGKPVPNFGDPNARLLVVGLAPGAHGANRTGRMFTGDRSGDFLYKVMHAAGFANQATCVDRDDGLELVDSLITAAAHCAPPGNKPTSQELHQCTNWFDATFELLGDLRVIITLGKIAHDSVLKRFKREGLIQTMAPWKFGHAAEHRIKGAPPILCCFHPSQQNTFTGRLTSEMMLDVFNRARQIIESP